MKIVNTSTKDKVYEAWLKSEFYRMKDSLSPEQVDIIENPNLDNRSENEQRENLIFNIYGRKPIMDHVPTDITWHEVEIEEKDIENLYLLAIWDWFIDTGKTFKLSGVLKNLSSGHGHRISNFPPGAADHKVKIDEMLKTPDTGVQDIIMISASETGPFTIIDGTHRSSFLTIKGGIPGTKAYLGIAPDLSKCVWAPEWEGYQQNILELNRIVDEGYLW
ncbi:hypothetical protein A2631_01745 [Candidatus Daviesbacteria bacterium RIFCSPHIGHO2_01_FULL_44_29]|uniref:Uncharacterized protein n=1 Tax=Candidatus Daviesbacteria bacterium RIFCSPHIGHO2_02_FULL_43_12 TaxID=1797776 RepID=A0A1F5KJS4_9BACT|nr:MAG: hypothetical protein A2631_01745 [Candidatus Daviesbacteria bacterium RIFCSPHIGHO2_01_FULL_44_29]OGE39032.1 MAG: hypothetical protein A3E86_00335 [Candidatus Daviesbacteria bacterium RIFCSPHIGHO2_12_FULL_47_45]OGE41124.1 MAG: hypothetical protein A3D25_01140 [Candidatus Daviesbacteria bacterium RIFCSPHIGHO2_02_FULL_43_12]OGE69323.1 MAG: hypothetical protein A3B55_02880 [Candidatus Daviesbacteria bacterium RIFCSPLOWO2_01_FULL_43_15]